MRHKAVPAATMIVAAGLIGITQARLPRPIRGYRERVSVEMSTIALLLKQVGLIELSDKLADEMGRFPLIPEMS
jgi:hypothetical protein